MFGGGILVLQMQNPIHLTLYQVYILLAQLITDDALIDHVAEVVIVICL